MGTLDLVVRGGEPQLRTRVVITWNVYCEAPTRQQVHSIPWMTLDVATPGNEWTKFFDADIPYA